MELRELVRLNSVAAQLIKHCSSPPLSEGPRGPMVSYCGTLTGFHSAPSQPIVSRRREHALDVLEREHGAGNVSHQILRFGPFSKVLPSPPTAFRHLRGAEASGPSSASPLYATLSERNKLLINAKLKRKVSQRNSSLYEFNHSGRCWLVRPIGSHVRFHQTIFKFKYYADYAFNPRSAVHFCIW